MHFQKLFEFANLSPSLLQDSFGAKTTGVVELRGGCYRPGDLSWIQKRQDHSNKHAACQNDFLKAK